MTAALIVLVWLAFFLFITFVMVTIITLNYSDISALYKMYAIRDRLVHSVVFEGIDRNDQFFSALYGNVNDLLSSWKFVSGSEGWPLAIKVGKSLANKAIKSNNSQWPIPSDANPPAVLVPVLKDLDDALIYMVKNHFGLHLIFSTKAREQRRLHREKARKLRMMLNDCDRCHA